MIELKPSQETASNKVKPSINSNEDKPFGGSSVEGFGGGYGINLIELKDHEHAHSIDNFKHDFAKNLVWVCLGALGLTAIADTVASCYSVSTNSFSTISEIFKALVMAAVGYLFGVKN
jgi:hypothetical protein